MPTNTTETPCRHHAHWHHWCLGCNAAATTARRILLCRRCGQPTGIAGAVYCDDCRPHRTTDALMSDVDRAREEGAR